MAQMVVNLFVRDCFVPRNLKITDFKVFKSSTVWLVMNSNSTGSSIAVYTSVTAMRKISKAVAELLCQLSGKKFKRILFKRISAAHADPKQINQILENIVVACEEFCA